MAASGEGVGSNRSFVGAVGTAQSSLSSQYPASAGSGVCTMVARRHAVGSIKPSVFFCSVRRRMMSKVPSRFEVRSTAFGSRARFRRHASPHKHVTRSQRHHQLRRERRRQPPTSTASSIPRMVLFVVVIRTSPTNSVSETPMQQCRATLQQTACPGDHCEVAFNHCSSRSSSHAFTMMMHSVEAAPVQQIHEELKGRSLTTAIGHINKVSGIIYSPRQSKSKASNIHRGIFGIADIRTLT